MRIRRSEFGISIQANVCTHWVVRVNYRSIEPVVTDTILGRHKHASAVTWVQVVLNYVVSSGDDGTVKLWDLATGDFIRDLVLLESAGSGGTVNFSVVKATTDERAGQKTTSAILSPRCCVAYQMHRLGVGMCSWQS